jgi:hypothetical protein
MVRTPGLALAALVSALGCANLLDYDEISFEGAGAAAGGFGAVGGQAGTSNGGTSNGGTSNGGTSNGGTSNGGTSGEGGTSGSGGTTGDHYETKTETGATGSEPDGIIPVCCVPSSVEKARIMEGFDLLNQHRIANGKSALAYDTYLEASIEGHCHHMSIHTFFSHDAPEASVKSPWTRATLCGASANGENLYYGSTSAAGAMNAWIGSPGHNSNMLNDAFTRVGIGNYGTRWGQLFGS